MKNITIWILSAVMIAGTLFVTACTITRKPDGTIIAEPANGKPVEVPPRRVTRITINGDCYLKIEAPDGVDYCIPCDLEGTGYAEPCDTILSSSSGQPAEPGTTNGTHSTAGNNYQPHTLPSRQQLRFMSHLNEWLAQEGVAHNHDAIWNGFGLGQWSPGTNADVPISLVKLSDDTPSGYIKLMIITRTDWADPDTNGGGELEYYLLRDASDMVPDAMVLALSGTFQEVADAMKGFFDGPFVFVTDYMGSTILIAGDQNTITFSMNQNVLWQG
ncbi:MAG: hypothetical protein JJ916_13795 [Phycisphaerales bacterium]|nr:hypothetical protein [Phycisphaerales bacterium]